MGIMLFLQKHENQKITEKLWVNPNYALKNSGIGHDSGIRKFQIGKKYVMNFWNSITNHKTQFLSNELQKSLFCVFITILITKLKNSGFNFLDHILISVMGLKVNHANTYSIGHVWWHTSF